MEKSKKVGKVTLNDGKLDENETEPVPPTPGTSKKLMSVGNVSESRTTTVTTVARKSESRIVRAGKYSFNQALFKKGEIPGLRSTHRFPNTRPVIFKNKLIGWPQKFGPYATQLDKRRPPSPPPPTPVAIDVFPDPPRFPWVKLDKKEKAARNRRENQQSKFEKYGIHTTDPFANLELDKSCDLFCEDKQYRISPQFQDREFQLRFLVTIVTLGTLLYLPLVGFLVAYLYWPSIRDELIYFSYGNVTESLVVIGMLVCLYLLLFWFVGFFRHRPWNLIFLVVTLVLKMIIMCAISVLSDACYLIVALSNDPNRFVDQGRPNHIGILIDKLLHAEQHSFSYWMLLMIFHTIILHTILILILKFGKLYLRSFQVKVYIYCSFWILFCGQGVFLVLNIPELLFQGPPQYDLIQTTAAVFLAYLRTTTRIKTVCSLFQGKKCDITEKEYIYGIMRVSH